VGISTPFDSSLDFEVGNERSLDVDLRKLELALGAQILVAKTAGDLEIFFEAGDLQELLILLRRLRQGVERAGCEPGGHEEVPRALGRRIRKDRRLDLDESLLVEIVARRRRHPMAKAKVLRHLRTPEIEVAIFEAQVLIRDFRIELERQHVGFVQHRERRGDDLDRAGGQLVVDRALEARSDLSGHGDHVLGAQAVRLLCDGGMLLGTENDLRDALAVAKVDKDDAAMVAPRVDPPGQGGFGAGVGRAQRAAMVGAILHGEPLTLGGFQPPGKFVV
jgi:hypothetical protein